MIERADLPAPSWTGPGPSGGTGSTVSPLGEGLVTAEVVAAHLCVDVSTIYRLATSGALPVVVIGRTKRFRVADVRAFVDAATRGCTASRGTSGAGVDRVQQLLAGTRHGASRRSRPAHSNDLDVSAGQSVHPTPKQEPWRPPGLQRPEDN